MRRVPDRYGPHTVGYAGSTTGRWPGTVAAAGTTARSRFEPARPLVRFAHPTTDRVTVPVRPVVSPR
jgi:hypothetical protein